MPVVGPMPVGAPAWTAPPPGATPAVPATPTATAEAKAETPKLKKNAWLWVGITMSRVASAAATITERRFIRHLRKGLIA